MDIKKIIASLTLEEKAALLQGETTWTTFGTERLGIPSIFLSDGPVGLRKQAGAADHLGLNASVPATCFPTAATMANSWDVELGEALGRALGINNDSTLGFLSTLANNVSTFEIMNGMDAKGTVLNSAFAVSASFILADHLAFTLSYDSSYLLPMMVAKITSGIAAVLFALVIYKKVSSKTVKKEC